MHSSNMKKDLSIRILIADDHYIFRMGLVALVNTEPDMEVVAEAVDGAQAIDLFIKQNPDVAVLDSRMPVKDGIKAMTEIRSRNATAKILMLTAFDGDEDIYRGLEAGASGYVLKSSPGEKLIPAIRAVAAGQRWIPKEVAERLACRQLFEELTPREVQVLHELAKGLANKQIADVLAISEHTAKTYLKSILSKLHVADRTEAVAVAIRRGIVHF